MPSSQTSLEHQANAEMVRRARAGILYFAIASVVPFGLDPALIENPLAQVLTSVSLVTLGLRVWVLSGWDRLYESNPERTVAWFAAVSGVQAFCFSIAVSWCMVQLGLSNGYTFIATLALLIFALASAVGLAPNFALLRITIPCYLAMAAVTAFGIGGKVGIGLGLLIGANLMYLFAYGKQLHKSYWITLRTNLDLQQARDQADRANQTKSQFLTKISHELRTPIHGVMGMASLALDTELSKEAREYLTTIYDSSSGLLHLVNDLLDLSKVEAGRMELESIPFEAVETIRTVVTGLRSVAELKGIRLTSLLVGKAPGGLRGDPARIRQILTNLIGNAIKFTQAGSVTISLENTSQAPGRAELTFTVEDTGIGIDEASLDRIFDPFRQANSSVSRQFGGTGLGLSISKHLAELMNGSLTVTSTLGKGSTFRFKVTLPRETRDTAVATTEKHAVAMTPERTLRILVADDNPVNRRIASVQLSKWGHQVLLAADGVSAVEQGSSTTIDLILMDMQMPRLDGIGACQQLRDARSTVPIVAVTANGSAEDRRLCLAAGMNGVLAKPYTARELFDVVEAHSIKAVSAPAADPSHSYSSGR